MKPLRDLATGARKSWSTTVAGVVAGLAIILPELQAIFDGDAITAANWNQIVAGVLVALGLAAARDNATSSEAAGAGDK